MIRTRPDGTTYDDGQPPPLLERPAEPAPASLAAPALALPPTQLAPAAVPMERPAEPKKLVSWITADGVSVTSDEQVLSNYIRNTGPAGSAPSQGFSTGPGGNATGLTVPGSSQGSTVPVATPAPVEPLPADGSEPPVPAPMARPMTGLQKLTQTVVAVKPGRERDAVLAFRPQDYGIDPRIMTKYQQREFMAIESLQQYVSDGRANPVAAWKRIQDFARRHASTRYDPQEVTMYNQEVTRQRQEAAQQQQAERQAQQDAKGDQRHAEAKAERAADRQRQEQYHRETQEATKAKLADEKTTDEQKARVKAADVTVEGLKVGLGHLQVEADRLEAKADEYEVKVVGFRSAIEALEERNHVDSPMFTGDRKAAEKALEKYDAILQKKKDAATAAKDKYTSQKAKLEAAYAKLHELTGGPQTPASDSANPPATVKSEADYDAVPSGAEYVAPDGSTRRKK